MAKLGKRTTAAREAFVGKSDLTVEEAVALVKSNATAKFDETIEIAMNLGVDPRHADQMVRGVIALPNGTGKTVRVAVFARDAKAEEATKAGADIVGAEMDHDDVGQAGGDGPRQDGGHLIRAPSPVALVVTVEGGEIVGVPDGARHPAALDEIALAHEIDGMAAGQETDEGHVNRQIEKLSLVLVVTLPIM